jgi:hypothetical protein
MPPGMTIKLGALGRPILAPLSLLGIWLYRRHTHNETIRDTEGVGTAHDTCWKTASALFSSMAMARVTYQSAPNFLIQTRQRLPRLPPSIEHDGGWQ